MWGDEGRVGVGWGHPGVVRVSGLSLEPGAVPGHGETQPPAAAPASAVCRGDRGGAEPPVEN